MRALVDQLQGQRRFVHMAVVAVLADFGEGLDADGEFLAGAAHAPHCRKTGVFKLSNLYA